MPELDGVGFVREQMARRPVPIVIISVASESGEQVLAALDAGAIDFVQKPTALATDQLLEIGDELIEKVKAAARAPAPRPAGAGRRAPRRRACQPRRRVRHRRDRHLDRRAAGAARSLIPRLPADLPVPVAIVLHMPVGYTELYARKLDEHVGADGHRSAKAGSRSAPGTCLIAPAGRHLTLRRNGGGHGADAPRRAAARHAASAVGRRAVSVGGRRVRRARARRGDDRHGSRRPRRRGLDQGARAARILTEAEESCVVYGMPRSVVEAGLSDGAVAARADGRSDPGARMKHKILLVDDSALARRSMRAILEAAGYEVVEAEDGMAALERYFLEKPDVVLLDLVMKGMYGLDVLTKLRELDPRRARHRRLGRRADLVAADWSEAAARAGFLNKPVDREQSADDVVSRRARGRRVMELTAAPAGRAGRAAEHRLRPRGGVAVAADRPPRAARGAAGHDAPDRRARRGAASASSTTTSPACTRFSPARSPATRC